MDGTALFTHKCLRQGCRSPIKGRAAAKTPENLANLTNVYPKDVDLSKSLIQGKREAEGEIQ